MKHVDLSTEFGEAVPQFLDDRPDPFRTAFTEPTWRHASVLAMGALLAPGKRTVSSCLRITGNAECKSFSSFHQVLNRAQWEPSELSRILLQLLATNLVEEEPIVVGLDDTIERRWGIDRGKGALHRGENQWLAVATPRLKLCASHTITNLFGYLS